MSKHLVAVYGSLRKGMGNHPLLSHIPEHRDGATTEQYTMISLGGFPAVTLPSVSPSNVQVEVYEVDDRTFARLDSLEGYPTFYNRKEVDIQCDDGTMCRAWMYLIEDASRYGNRDVVESGDWVKYYYT